MRVGYSKVASLILDDWAPELATRCFKPEAEIRRTGLAPADYPNEIVEITFADESTATFRFAFVIISREKNAIGLFSGHSGHYVVPAPAVAHVRDQKGATLFDHAAWLKWATRE